MAEVSASYDGETHALCQDCLRLLPLADLIPDDNDPPGLCPVCKGTTCGCGFCMKGTRLLAAGDFSNVPVQPQWTVTAWAAEAGATVKFSPACFFERYGDSVEFILWCNHIDGGGNPNDFV